MRALKAGLAALAIAIAAAPAAANDSSAELAAGGLVLRRSDNIEMRSEDLYISAREVRVTYRFLNTSAQPVTTIVAFPMPDITITGEGDNISVPTEAPENFLDFHTSVDGRPVRAQVEQRVFKGQVERTALLRRLGVPLAPHLRGTMEAMDRLPRARQDELVRLGLAYPTEWDEGRGMERHLQPTWTLRTTYHWTQTFPAGREITVAHRYRPAVGMSAGTSMGSPGYRNSPERRERVRRYCVDSAFDAYVNRHLQDGFAQLVEERIEYVLTTGANWARPIGEFRMVIDKGSPNAVVSFCGEGVRRISPTQFEVRHRNYTPRRDVSVLILRPPDQAQ